MITSLTEQQIAKFPQYVEKYLKLGLSTRQLTKPLKEDIEQNMARIYEAGGLAAPKYCVFVDSPVACVDAYNFFEMALQKKSATIDSVYTAYMALSTVPTAASASSQLDNFSYGSLDAGWLSFYAFFLNETEVKNIEKVQPLIDLLGKCSFYLPYEEIVFISANPVQINMVNERLHSTTGPAWEYADGFCGYALDGVAVEKETIDAVMGKLPPESVLKISNVEQRLVGIKYIGPERLIAHLGGKVLDTKGGEYVLHAFSLEGEDCRMLEMQNPSEPKKHYEFVPPEIKTVNQALAWRIGWDSFQEPVVKT